MALGREILLTGLKNGQGPSPPGHIQNIQVFVFTVIVFNTWSVLGFSTM